MQKFPKHQRLVMAARAQPRLSSPGQHELLARMFDELRRLLGGWVRSLANRRTPRRNHRAFADGASWLDVRRSLEAWRGHAQHGDTEPLLDAVFAARPFRRASTSSASGT